MNIRPFLLFSSIIYHIIVVCISSHKQQINRVFKLEEDGTATVHGILFIPVFKQILFHDIVQKCCCKQK